MYENISAGFALQSSFNICSSFATILLSASSTCAAALSFCVAPDIFLLGNYKAGAAWGTKLVFEPYHLHIVWDCLVEALLNNKKSPGTRPMTR